MAISVPSHAPLAQVRLEDASAECFSHRDQDDAYLYHVTSADRVEDILVSGLTPGAPATVQGGAYRNYSRGKVFLTERSGVDFWKDRIEQHLEHAHDDPPEVAVIRVPRGLVKGIEPDEIGSKDSQHGAYFTESPVAPEADLSLVGFHGTRVMPEFTSFSCDGPPSDDRGDAVSSGSGPDVTAYMGAHFAKEWTVARKFATAGEGWLRSRYDGEETRPRVMRCALNIKNPITFKSEDTLRNQAYLQSISDENILEPAMRRTGAELCTETGDAWLEKYDASGEMRLETHRWLFEQYRPSEGEEEGLRDAARELAAAAVADLKKRGHDGIIYANQVEGGTGVVVFEPEQVTMLSVEYLNEKDRSQPSEEDITAKLMKGHAQIAPPEPAPAKEPRFSVEQGSALDDMSGRTRGFGDYVADLYEDPKERAEALNDDEERRVMARDFLRDTHQIEIDRHGIVNFELLTDEARRIIGDRPVRLYHHTSTAVSEKIRQEGLRPQPGANVNCLDSGSGARCVFLTAEAGGAAPDVYLGHATRYHGGEPETLRVLMCLRELKPDQDDSDIKSGRYQFTALQVSPDRIENFAKPRELVKSTNGHSQAMSMDPSP